MASKSEYNRNYANASKCLGLPLPHLHYKAICRNISMTPVKGNACYCLIRIQSLDVELSYGIFHCELAKI